MVNKPLTVVTGNTSKFEEMKEALSHFDIVVERVNFCLLEAKDLQGEVVVRDKAWKAFKHIGGPVLVDDSGFYVEKLNGFPGTYSKFAYETIGFDGLFRLFSVGDQAYFLSFVSYMDQSLDSPKIFEGRYSGRIVDGFDHTQKYEMPYAILFQPDESDKCLSEMSSLERKNDHRHRALQQFAKWYRTKRL